MQSNQCAYAEQFPPGCTTYLFQFAGQFHYGNKGDNSNKDSPPHQQPFVQGYGPAKHPGKAPQKDGNVQFY